MRLRMGRMNVCRITGGVKFTLGVSMDTVCSYSPCYTTLHGGYNRRHKNAFGKRIMRHHKIVNKTNNRIEE